MNNLKKFCSVIFLAASFASLTSVAGAASSDAKSGAVVYVDDTVLTAKVKAALLGESNLKSNDISVETLNGVVQLSGSMDSQSALDRAIAVAQGVDGVHSVKNEMQLK